MIYELFDQQVQRHPNKLAVVCGDSSVTYLGLARIAADLEHEHLAAHPHPLRLFTGILDNSIESVATLLMAAKLGATVMPGRFSEELQRATIAQLHDHYLSYGEERPYLLLKTSGTTAEPKLIALHQDTKLLRAQACAELYGVTESDYVLASTPLEHSLAQRLVFTALLHGATVELLPRYSPELWLSAMQRMTFTMAVPQQLNTLLGGVVQLGRTRCLVSSSATLTPQLRELLGGKKEIHHCYGTSEIAVATSGKIRKLGSDVGTAAPKVEVRVDEYGEIQVRTPLVMSGYFGSPMLTRASFTEDSFFRTGDGGVLKQGRLHLTGRLSDMIKVGALRVNPEQVELALARVGWRQLVAFGISDSKLGEKVVLGSEDVDHVDDLRRIQHMVAEDLADHEMPRDIFYFPNGFPRTVTGKVMRRKMREMVEARL